MAEIVREETKKQQEKRKSNSNGDIQKEDVGTVVEDYKRRSHTFSHMPPRRSRLTTPPSGKALAKYLWHAVKVWDAMDCHPDEELLRDYVHYEPPLHLRRTLDQSRYGTLEDTESRDLDQVVSRGTKVPRGNRHGATRVVMVDQLWLWILDESMWIMHHSPTVLIQ